MSEKAWEVIATTLRSKVTAENTFAWAKTLDWDLYVEFTAEKERDAFTMDFDTIWSERIQYWCCTPFSVYF